MTAAKLTQEQYKDVADRYGRDELLTSIAASYRITTQAVRMIAKRFGLPPRGRQRIQRKTHPKS